jgi:ABC-type polar amino acid transport system ATPase subunit
VTIQPPVVEIAGVSKDYLGLRPLRIESLRLAAGEHVAILGLDQPMAETFINLVTGAVLPDRGDVHMFGRSTAAIRDSEEWLTVIDRIGIVSERAVLLDTLSVIQNLAMPFTLDIDPLSEAVRSRAARLAGEAGLPQASWSRPASELDPPGRMRVRIARALALDPDVLLLDHVSATLPAASAREVAADIRRLAARRGAALIAATVDKDFAADVAGRVLTLDAATGRLLERVGLLGRLRRR